MAKSNPLFVDSTKFQGDLIVTHIELKDVLIYEEEMLSVIVTNHQGITRTMEMTVVEGRSFEARIHLNHQTAFTYQFVIEKGGARVYQSLIFEGRASYSVVQKWNPVLEDPAKDLPPTVEVVDAAATTSEEEDVDPSLAWARESSKEVKSLIDKWGF